MNNQPLNYLIFNALSRTWVKNERGGQSDSFFDAMDIATLEEANTLYEKLDKHVGGATFYVLAVMPSP